MAPTKKDDKEKEAKLNPQESAALIMDYLRKQNRPYSATDVSTNLKNRVTKSAAAKLLKDMHERHEIEGRAAGKQIVYHVIQEEPDEDAVQKLQEMDEQTTRLKEATAALKAEEKELRATARDGAAQVPLAELKASVDALEQEKADMTARLDKLKSGSLKPVSAEERESLSKERKKWEKTVLARRKIRKELWEQVQDMTEKSEWANIKENLDLHF